MAGQHGGEWALDRLPSTLDVTPCSERAITDFELDDVDHVRQIEDLRQHLADLAAIGPDALETA